MKPRGLDLLSVVLICGIAAGQAPTKNPRYEEFRKAPLVLIAKLEAASVTAVQESFPPRYIYAVSLIPTEVLRGGFEKGRVVKCSHGIASVNEPKLPVGKEVLVQLQMLPRSGLRIVKMEEPTADLKAAARAATGAGKAEAARDDELARKEPEKHSRFKEFKEAVGVAILTADADGVAAFDVQTQTTTLSTKALAVLKGDLKPGAVKVHFSQTVKVPPAKSWLVTFKVEDGKVWLVSADAASEMLVLVARAAAKK